MTAEQVPTTCGWTGCDKAPRALGYCDTHYRHYRRRDQGIGGITPMDGTVYKLRLRKASGNQPVYYSNRTKAFEAAAAAEAEGTLLYFARYTHSEDLL